MIAAGVEESALAREASEPDRADTRRRVLETLASIRREPQSYAVSSLCDVATMLLDHVAPPRAANSGRARRAPPVRAMNVAVDTLDSIAGDLLSLESTVTTQKTIDDDTREHLRSELAATRRRVMQVTQLLHDERRTAR